MRAKLEAKIDALSAEAQTLTEERFHLVERLKAIDQRLTQLVGALSEMQPLLDDYAELREDQPASFPPLPQP